MNKKQYNHTYKPQIITPYGTECVINLKYLKTITFNTSCITNEISIVNTIDRVRWLKVSYRAVGGIGMGINLDYYVDGNYPILFIYIRLSDILDYLNSGVVYPTEHERVLGLLKYKGRVTE